MWLALDTPPATLISDDISVIRWWFVSIVERIWSRLAYLD